MRHSRFTQSYRALSHSLEVTEAEMFAQPALKGWTCETIAQMGIPQTNFSQATQPEVPLKSGHSAIVRRSRSVAEIHQGAIQRNVTRRMEAAKSRGDVTLLGALEAELRDLISA